ncbi:MAG: hypothetical protein GX677_07300 [Treponema sp.]|jgi:hypothetical protein|nr:hypothetical protein [Treponema sp.]
MTIYLLLSIIPLCISTVLAILTSGGNILEILDWISFAGVVILFVTAIFISGYGKDFCRIFSSRKKFESLDLQKLQKTDSALEFASKILFYTAILIPVLILIYTLRNYNNDSEIYSHLGPNCAALLLSILYLSLLEMIIYTLKSKARKSVILYMAEEKKSESVEKKDNHQSIIKMLLGIVIFIAICILYGYVSGVYEWGKHSLFSTILNIPVILIMIIYVVPLIAISGNFNFFLASIKTTFSGRKINISQKNLYLNIVQTTMRLNWYAAFSSAVCGWIGMLSNLEDTSLLAPNLSVSLIPFFYATCLNLFLLLIEIKVHKASE